jgi:hypothetical protein
VKHSRECHEGIGVQVEGIGRRHQGQSVSGQQLSLINFLSASESTGADLTPHRLRNEIVFRRCASGRFGKRKRIVYPPLREDSVGKRCRMHREP